MQGHLLHAYSKVSLTEQDSLMGKCNPDGISNG